MQLSVLEQIVEVLNKSKRLLVLVSEPKNADVVAGALALKRFLHKQEKEVTLVAPSDMPERLRFLPGAENFTTQLNSAKDFTITVDIRTKPLDEISYQTEANAVHIYVKPKAGQFTPEDVSFSSVKQAYDAVLLLGVTNLETLGSLLETGSELLFEAPKINIDTNPANEYYGAINYVDINATSVCELLANLFEKFEQSLMDEDVATALLTGIIAKTNSFQQSHTTPKAFLKASELIALGGRQQEVIKYLFKTKPLPLLRLWGRALARLKMHETLPVMYSMLNLSDFGKAGASSEDLHLVLKELLENISGYKVVGLLSESMGGHVCIQMAIHQQVNADELARSLGTLEKVNGQGGPFSVVEVELKNTSITDAEQRFLESVKNAVAANN